MVPMSRVALTVAMVSAMVMKIPGNMAARRTVVVIGMKLHAMAARMAVSMKTMRVMASISARAVRMKTRASVAATGFAS
jgi:hypothetical protein